MNKIIFVGLIVLVLLGLSIYGLNGFVGQGNTVNENQAKQTSQDNQPASSDFDKTDAEWREILTPMQFKVARKHGTERAFTGEYWDNKREGVYNCICCGLPLFGSDTKYKSGTGWPSFWKPLNEQAIGSQEDNTLFSRRTEVHCSRCKAHLGHVFDDGPQPTGLRYCLNSASLKFEEANEPGTDQANEE